MAQQKTPLYKSEVFIPITKDTQTFEQRQKTIFEDMQERMERRRQQWSDQMERMRRDFFQLKPVAETRRGSSENLLESRRLNDLFYDDGGASAGVGGRKFCVSFDIRSRSSTLRFCMVISSVATTVVMQGRLPIDIDYRILQKYNKNATIASLD